MGGGGILHVMLIINRRRKPNPPIGESLLSSTGRQLAPANENRLEVQRQKTSPIQLVQSFDISHQTHFPESDYTSRVPLDQEESAARQGTSHPCAKSC